MQNLSETIGQLLQKRDSIEAGDAMTVDSLLDTISDLENFLLDPWDGEDDPTLDPAKF